MTENSEQHSQPNNPLHGIRLDHILQHLLEFYGWQELGERITIKCFTPNPLGSGAGRGVVFEIAEGCEERSRITFEVLKTSKV